MAWNVFRSPYTNFCCSSPYLPTPFWPSPSVQPLALATTGQQRSPSRHGDAYANLLRRWLPEFEAQLGIRSNNEDALAETFSGHVFNEALHVDRDKLFATYQRLVQFVRDATQQNDYYGTNGADSYIQMQINAALERNYAEDEAGIFQRMRLDGHHSSTLSLFSRLATIAGQTVSPRLSKVLGDFFCSDRGYHIANHDSDEAVTQWALAITHMPSENRYRSACLCVIASGRPELSRELRQSSRKVMRQLALQLDLSMDERGMIDGERHPYGYSVLQYRRGRQLSRPSLGDHGRSLDSDLVRYPDFEDDYEYENEGMRGPLRGVVRSRSQPALARRRVAEQAERVMDFAEELHSEAQRLHRVASQGF